MNHGQPITHQFMDWSRIRRMAIHPKLDPDTPLTVGNLHTTLQLASLFQDKTFAHPTSPPVEGRWFDGVVGMHPFSLLHRAGHYTGIEPLDRPLVNLVLGPDRGRELRC